MADLSALVAKLSPEGRAALARELAAAGAPAPEPAGPAAPEPIALVGIGCRYPGGITTPDGFWQLVSEGRDAIGPVPTDRWDPIDLDDLGWRWGGFLDDVSGFDAGFFGISPREAQAMDPQHRLLLEVLWEALEHAGVPPRGLGGSRTGVFVGIAAADYLIERLRDQEALTDPYTITGTAHSTAVGRLSYLLDLRGPSIALDTACSSSLVTVHLACESLRGGDSDLAVAGGVHVLSSPDTTIAMGSAEVAPSDADGRTKAFDAAARGTSRAEGCGMVVLKRLSDARRDGDRILAVIRGSAVNQDGRSNGLTAPSAVSQRIVLQEAVDRAGIDPRRLGMVECHGTGTVLGDPIEVEALTGVYAQGDGRLALGAVKTNLGHCEEAAGVAGLIKATLALGAGEVPPNLHFRSLNPNITFDGTRFFVPTARTPWPVEGGPRLAAVSSFGMGGTNAHIVLEQAPDPEPVDEPAAGRPQVVLLSGATPSGLKANASVLADWLPGADVPLADVAATAGRRRSHATSRLGVVASSTEELGARLRTYLAEGAAPGTATGTLLPAVAAGAGVVFVFSGFGSQWDGMGRELLATEPAFAAVIDELEPVVQAESGFSLRELIGSGQWQTAQVPVLVYAVQIGLAEVWRARGVRPAAVVGHSVGEIAAAVVARGLSRADGARVVARRSSTFAPLVGTGAMALVGLPPERVEPRLADVDGASVAVWASPNATVIAGDAVRIEELVAEWTEAGVFARAVAGANAPGHSPAVDPMLPAFREALAGIEASAPRLDFYSTALSDPRAAADLGPEYWLTNIRNPVRFTAGIAAAAADGYRAFVEISPHPLVVNAVEETLAGTAAADNAVVAHTVRRNKPERAILLEQLAALYCAGVPVDTGRLFGRRPPVDLPFTAWQRRPYWFRLGVRGAGAQAHPLLGVHVALPEAPVRHVWQTEVSTARLGWLADHRYEDLPVMPGTGYVEMALAAACEAFGAKPTEVTLSGVEYQQPLLLADPVTVTTQLTVRGPRSGVVEISTGDGPARAIHSVASVSAGDPAPRPAPLDVAALAAAHGDRLDPATAVYGPMRAIGQIHGPAFTGLRELSVNRDAGTGLVTSTWAGVVWPEDARRDRRLHLHPAMLDTSFHGSIAGVPDTSGAFYLPTGMAAVRVWGDLATVTHAYATVGDPVERGFAGTVRLLDATGAVVLEAVDMAIRQVDESSLPVSLAGKLYERVWEETPLPAGEPAEAGPWLVLGADDGWRAAVASALDGAAVGGLDDPVAAEVGGVVVLAGADDGPLFGGGADVEALVAAEAVVLDVARVVARLAERTGSGSPRLWVVTRGSQVVEADPATAPTPDLVGGGLRGLVRTLVLEHSDLRPALVDLDPRGLVDPAEAAGGLAAELRSGATDDEVAWRRGTRYVDRLAQVALTPGGPTVPFVRRGGGYAVTGGLTGIGLTVARFLVERGAGVVALNARSAPSADAEKAIDEMRAAGAEIVVVNGDIAAAGTAERLVAAVTGTGTPLHGVVHSAAWLDDCLVTALDAERLHKPWWPKAVGAWRLHEAVSGAAAGVELDWFVGFSSLASLLGGPGQGNYAAASSFVDTLALWRRSRGLTALTVDWGGWAEVGFAKDLKHDAIGMLRPKEGLTALAELVGHDKHLDGVARLHLGLLPEVTPELTRSSFFTRVLAGAAADEADDWPGPSSLAGLPADELKRAVRRRLQQRVARVMGFALADLPTRTPLVHLGLDSLMAVRIKNAVSADFGVNLPVAIFLQGVGVADLEAEVLKELSGAADGAGEPVGQGAAGGSGGPGGPGGSGGGQPTADAAAGGAGEAPTDAVVSRAQARAEARRAARQRGAR